MGRNAGNYLRLLSARFLLFMAALLLLLFLGNLRSHFLYNAPNLAFLFLISCAYCFLAGIGLQKLKKWALLLFVLAGYFVYGRLCVWRGIRCESSDAVGAYELCFFGYADCISCLYAAVLEHI